MRSKRRVSMLGATADQRDSLLPGVRQPGGALAELPPNASFCESTLVEVWQSGAGTPALQGEASWREFK
jgi:hypothetical protein